MIQREAPGEMAKEAEQATLRESAYVHKAAQVASITHSWGNQDKNLNAILNLGVLSGTMPPEKINPEQA